MLCGADARGNPYPMAQRLTDRVVKSAERTLAVFEIFSQEQRGLRVGEVSRNLGIPQPSASMLLKNLVRLGYLRHDPQCRTFSPTIRLVLLGSWLSRRCPTGGDLDERLANLQSEVGSSVYVAMQNASAIQYIFAQDHPQAGGPLIRSGRTRPLTTCASGHVLLSSKSDAEIRGWIRRSNAEALDDRDRVSEHDLVQLIHKVRRSGYAETIADTFEQPAEIAVSIVSPFDNSLLAIAVGGAADRLSTRKDLIVSTLKRFKCNFGQESSAFVAAA
jgi:IclR family transcriptional regulator, KDG regulon repressor